MDLPVKSTNAFHDFTWSLERRILAKTSGRVRRLHVEMVSGRVVVRGLCPTYHVKQLAIQALLELSPQALLPCAIEIEVG